jgi:signal transduction histidine kinase/CheY-like chemotaxis protein
MPKGYTFVAFLFLLLWVVPCQAQPDALMGNWYRVLPVAGDANQQELKPVSGPAATGGVFLYRAKFRVAPQKGVLVLDFKNSSVIGKFHHRVFDSRHRLVADLAGGIQSSIPNPYFLRHGRDLNLAPGYYYLDTEVSSPFLLAQPEPYLDTQQHYRQAIKAGNAITLWCMGLLAGLAFYYAVLSLIRHTATNALYSLFILGNLLYNGTALLVYPELFGFHGFYLISFPILFSNVAYVLFVMKLLNIERGNSVRLHAAAMALLALLAVSIVVGLLKPNWSLELDRLGVGLFLCFGFVAGLARARQGSPTARMYLFAIAVFFVLGMMSILLNKLGDTYTLYVEHLGLVAVTAEALLLALVLARQFDQLHHEKERAITDSLDKSRFLAAASHDLRQPLHALSLFVWELGATVNTLQQRKLVGLIEESVQAMSGLLDSLLDLSKLDAGLVRPSIEPVDIRNLLIRMQQEYVPLAAAQGIGMRIHFLDATVESDPILLERILRNLLSNAIRYTPRGGRILLACRRRGQQLRIEVRDNGIGIPQDKQQEMFREFVQLGNSERSRDKGLGLGLSIVQRLCRLMNLQLDLRSAPGRGSVFAISVPLAQAALEVAAEPTAVVMQDDSGSAEAMSAARLLVVEDDPLVQASTQRLLASWGYEVHLAGSLQQAREQLSRRAFDLLVCDHRLPDGNGLEVLRMAEEICDERPASILISGDTAPDLLKQAQAADYHLLHKPVNPAKLHSLVLFLLKQERSGNLGTMEGILDNG